MAQGDQFGRAYNLTVTSPGGFGVDLSELKFSFSVTAADVETPNRAEIRVYNLSDATLNAILNEFTGVVLNAGYTKGSYGIIFSGDIKQFRHGKENNVDTYIDILAADGDLYYNFGVINQTTGPDSNPSDRINQIAQKLGDKLDPNAEASVATGGILPRPSIMFGMARAYMRELAKSANARWSIQNGFVTVIPDTGYLPGTAVQLNSRTGMVGQPEVTQDGIKVRTLLNPNLKIGGQVQINNKDINSTKLLQQGYPSYTDLSYYASESADGFYRIIVVSHSGDTRSQDWHTELVVLNLDQTSSIANAVSKFGAGQ